MGVSLLRSALAMQVDPSRLGGRRGARRRARHALGRDHGPPSDEERQPLHLGQHAALLDGAVRADRPSRARERSALRHGEEAGRACRPSSCPGFARRSQARTALEWEALFGERVPCAAARAVEDMFDHPQVASEGILGELRASPHRTLPRDGASDPLRRRTRAGSVRRAGAGAALARDPGVARLRGRGDRAAAEHGSHRRHPRRARGPERGGSPHAQQAVRARLAPRALRQGAGQRGRRHLLRPGGRRPGEPKGRGATDAAGVPEGDAALGPAARSSSCG